MSEKPQGEVVEAKVRAAYRDTGHTTPDLELAEKKRRAAVADTSGAKPNDKMIAALLRERAGLAQQGKSERVEQVDAQLEHYGYKPDGTKSADAGDGGKQDDGKQQEARKQPPQGRSAKPQQTGN